MLLKRHSMTDRGVRAAKSEYVPHIDHRWRDIQSRMSAHGIPDLAIRIFRKHYAQLLEGHSCFIRESEIQPVEVIPDLETLPDNLEESGRDALSKTIVLKLNGGLGTSMGLDGPKSLLPVRDHLTFLDLIVAQAQYHSLPLLLMNSFATDEESGRALKSRGAVDRDRLLTFQQHAVPKICVDDYSAAEYYPDPDLAWCPPGHGDLYASLLTSGMLPRLLQHKCRFMFVSNADNLGATLDLRLLGYLARNKISFLMEVADRTNADRKGGHLARRWDGTLVLRESGQCHPEEREAFQDISRYHYFNTNNLWVDLQALGKALAHCDGALPLPLILNRKTLDPRDASSPEVLQLETAMGAAISLLPGAQAVRVPRSRFAPVKTTGDLLAVRSDAYEVDKRSSIQLIPERTGSPPALTLDDRFYRRIGDLDERIPTCPSLRRCRSLRISGEFQVPAGAVFVGDVDLVNHRSAAVRLNAGEITGNCVFAIP